MDDKELKALINKHRTINIDSGEWCNKLLWEYVNSCDHMGIFFNLRDVSYKSGEQGHLGVKAGALGMDKYFDEVVRHHLTTYYHSRIDSGSIQYNISPKNPEEYVGYYSEAFGSFAMSSPNTFKLEINIHGLWESKAEELSIQIHVSRDQAIYNFTTVTKKYFQLLEDYKEKLLSDEEVEDTLIERGIIDEY